MKRRIVIFALCVLPIMLAFYIRHCYVNSPQYAFRSFLVALESKDRIEIQKWTTTSAFKNMMSLTVHQPVNIKLIAMNGWADWAQQLRLNKQTSSYSLSYKNISNRPFATISSASIVFVFAYSNGQWKLIAYGEPDTLQLRMDEALWEWSQQK